MCLFWKDRFIPLIICPQADSKKCNNFGDAKRSFAVISELLTFGF